ncbi:potassium transporter [Coprinopsis marcescibilis]|uniref:Potassium transporter n=1 Tax=Coprinopsis marcescibilis TaxID=230819 RepID=A0A5C3LGK0_COPMA|nr:potassium transporter [Coprinopsis marcescibilis]
MKDVVDINSKRAPVSVSGLALAALSFQTLGIIYSDIGTSPLYVLNGIWPASGEVPSQEDVIGGISAIIWSLTLLPLIKYVFVSLYFSTTEGEGGSFALYQGIYPRTEQDFGEDRALTGDSQDFKPHVKKQTFKQKIQFPLLLWCLFGTALTMADGALTPAVSVTSAVGGIGVAQPSVVSNIIPISIAFIVVLFFAQQLGTARLAFTFAPVSLIWFLLLAGTGIYNITTFPGVFRAFDPSRAILLFVRTKNYDLMAGILLAVTGCEAIFANLGQFNRASIRFSFCFIAYPSLVLAYLGQGARLIQEGSNVMDNIFYRTIPGPINGPLYWIVFVFAVLATLIASQAMITATFSLVQQVINLKSLPPIRMHHTSETIQGQVYVPVVNWILMIVTIVLVGAFSNLSNLTNAYGFAVATVMLSTTGLLAIQMFYVKKWPIIVGAVFFLFFGFIDGAFWGASAKKVPHGAWVPLMLGIVLALLMVLWTWGKALEDKFDGVNRMNLRHFIGLYADPDESDGIESSDNSGKSGYFLHKTNGDVSSSEQEKQEDGSEPRKELVRISTCAIFHKISQGKGVPHTFVGFVRQWPALPRVVIFLSVCVTPLARVPKNEQYIVTKVRSLDGFYGVTYYLGFRDNFDVQIEDLVEKIVQIEQEVNPNAEIAISEIRLAIAEATHIAPHYHVLSKRVQAGLFTPVANYIRSLLIETLYRRIATMFPETENWLTSADKIIHVGINAVI